MDTQFMSSTRISCRRFSRQRSQGGAKLPTGGNYEHVEARERPGLYSGVSRSGLIPEPTVIVRMKE